MRIAPTARGAGLFAAGVAALLAAHAFGTQALVPVAVGMIALPLAALVLVAAAAALLRPERAITPAHARAGETLTVETRAAGLGGGWLARLAGVRIDARAAAVGSVTARHGGTRTALARRGRHVLAPPVLRAADPFGLARARRAGSEGPREVLVLPRLVRLPAPGDILRAARAQGGRRGPQGWGELDRVREYHRGDPMSRIHWRQTAKRGELHTKVLGGSDGERTATAIVLDALGDGAEQAGFEEAVTAAASLARSIDEAGGSPTLHLAGAGGGTVSGRWTTIDRALADVSPGGAGGLADALRAAAGSAHGGLLVVSARPAADLRAAARMAGSGAALVLVGPAAATAPALRAAGVAVISAAQAEGLAFPGRARAAA